MGEWVGLGGQGKQYLLYSLCDLICARWSADGRSTPSTPKCEPRFSARHISDSSVYRVQARSKFVWRRRSEASRSARPQECTRAKARHTLLKVGKCQKLELCTALWRQVHLGQKRAPRFGDARIFHGRDIRDNARLTKMCATLRRWPHFAYKSALGPSETRILEGQRVRKRNRCAPPSAPEPEKWTTHRGDSHFEKNGDKMKARQADEKYCFRKLIDWSTRGWVSGWIQLRLEVKLFRFSLARPSKTLGPAKSASRGTMGLCRPMREEKSCTMWQSSAFAIRFGKPCTMCHDATDHAM